MERAQQATKARNSRSQPTTPRRNRGPPKNRSGFVTKQELRGGKIDVPTNPPEITYQPWMPLTVVHSGVSGEINITVRDLVRQIAQQIDPHGHGLRPFAEAWASTECIMQLRVTRIRAWNITGRMISLSVDDFSSADKAIADVDTLCGIVDTGSSMHIPAVGYALPASHQNIVLRNDKLTNDAIIYHVMCPSTDTCIIYTNVMFRFDGPAKFNTFQDSMSRLVRGIGKDVKEIKRAQQAMEPAIQKIAERESTTSVGNAIVKGIEITAPYIIPAVAAVDDTLHDKVDKLTDLVLRSGLDDVSIISGHSVEDE